MPSADFCLFTTKISSRCAIGVIGSISPGDELKGAKAFVDQSLTGYSDRVLSRSPRIRTLTVTTQLHHLRWPLDHVASLSCANSPPAYASYDVLVHQLVVLLAASSRQNLTILPLPFASSCRLIEFYVDGGLPTVDFPH